MKIIRTTTLTKAQEEEIDILIQACKKEYPLTLSFPIEDGTSFYLLYDPELVCALSLISSESPIECVAFTLPSRQNSGYFSILFDKVGEEIQEAELVFPIDGSNTGALMTLESLGAEPYYDECRMDLNLTAAGSVPQTYASNNREVSRLRFDYTVSEDQTVFTFFLKSDSNRVSIGICHMMSYGESACLYNFEISDQFRGLGLGTEAWFHIINYLNTQQLHSVFLQVSGNNAAAIRIYEKAGFRISETLSYYLY
ncbi:MAG: GNAT family N-acetyltransferase [Clostridium sp.]